jgi:hypothetical protein
MMILLSAHGFTAQEIAEVQRVTDVTIYKWIRRFREGGPSSLNARLSTPSTPLRHIPPLRAAPTSHRSLSFRPALHPIATGFSSSGSGAGVPAAGSVIFGIVWGKYTIVWVASIIV